MIRINSMPHTYGKQVLILGASGAIGHALTRLLIHDPEVATIFAASRRGIQNANSKITQLYIDCENEESLAKAVEQCRQAGPLDMVINAIGLLQDGNSLMPEKGLRDIRSENLKKLFWLNSIVPALIMTHFTPLMAQDRRTIFATLSARVGSIGDNRKGGWYGYRASKAALNQLIKTASIELAFRRPKLICVGLHPGTVRSRMSEPFLTHYNNNDIFSPEFAAQALLDVLATLTPSHSGRIFAWDGQEIPP
ncbi:SDR family NAD(P)-dependent oxidoreductase [Candidatus Phycosocius spiralis]|uniref:SDR family NAD(P)-dependent oxidoreductase n=1 Tax=Candidatus Phycosocius spiralis TaxID=2815099 RepID=UPI0024E0A02B|nr:SDR family NAD(P)-dependent oxidoreductase [Candidatus Phycosocius spiralis]